MKILYSTLLIIFLISAKIPAQVSITPEQEKALKNEAKKWVDTYGSNLNNIGSSYLTVFDKTEVIEDIIKQFENDNVIVFNDLDISGTTPKDFKIRQHLGNIISWFTKEGVTFAFKNIKLSDVFLNKNDNSLFIKAELDREINGTNVYNKQINNTTKIDCYIKYIFQNNQISPKPIFYSISDRIDNMNNFTKVQVTTQSAGTIKISDDRKDIDAVVNAAKAKQEEIKKKIEDTDRKKAEAIAKAEAAKQNQKKYEEAKNMSMLGFSVYLSKIYNGEFHVAVTKGIFRFKQYINCIAQVEGGSYFKVPGKNIAKHDKVKEEAYFNTSDRLSYGSGLTGKAGVKIWLNLFRKMPFTLGYLYTSEKQTWDPKQSSKYFIQRTSKGRQYLCEFDFPFVSKIKNNYIRSFLYKLDFYVSYNKFNYIKYTAVNYTGSIAPIADIIKTKAEKISYWNFGFKVYIPLYY